MKTQTELNITNDEPATGHRVLETSKSQKPNANSDADHRGEERRLSPGDWLRAVEDFHAPFGFDRMPTVWG